MRKPETPTKKSPTWVKIIDQHRCIGCHACTVACKSENDVPLGVNRTFVKEVESGRYPETTKSFQVTRCNQCENAPCTTVCPTEAMYHRQDGIVDFNRNICIGCKACLNACPYDAIYIDPVSNSAEKCNFCAHRIDRNLEPACVSICPTEAIIVGNYNNPTENLQRYITDPKIRVRKPERGTKPRLFYSGKEENRLNPLNVKVTRTRSMLEYPTGATITQAAQLIGDGGTRTAPWGWKVSTYIWTKAIASGPFILWPFLALWLPLDRQEWTISLAVIGIISLLITAALLIADLTHPKRFYFLLLRPNWRSWLVRGGLLLTTAIGSVGLFLIAGLADLKIFTIVAGWLLLPTAIGLSVYTAFLFRDSKGCQLWQNPLLPINFLVQALAIGIALLLLIESAAQLPWSDLCILLTLFVIISGLHAALIISEFTSLTRNRSQSNAEIRMALQVLRRGQLGVWFGIGLVGSTVATVIAALSIATTDPTLGYLAAGIIIIAVGSYEHAHVQAGQAIPLA